MLIRNVLLALAASLCINASVLADVLKLNPNHPQTYVVVKGDTLWDISSKFLRDPWRWPEIWNYNPEITNPHLIYPGDVITLVYRDGKPMLQVKRGRQTIKLSPKTRSTRLTSAIPTVASDAISQFLAAPRVLTKKEIEAAGYVASSEEEHLVTGTGGKIYAVNLNQDADKDFSVFRIGETYHNPEGGDVLGYEAIHVSDAQLIRKGEPATLRIIESYRETLLGDKILPTDEEELDQNFTPHAPDRKVEGQIISIMDGVSRAGQYQTVVINLGKEDGIELGHVLGVKQSGETIKDRFSSGFFKSKIKIPDETAGLLMVVNAFDRVSYALIMSAVKDVRLKDPVGNP